MTKEEIMKMDDRELYRKIILFITPKDEVDTMIESGADTIFAQDSEHNLEMALWWCYQAEEKLLSNSSMGNKWADNLEWAVNQEGEWDRINFYHSDPHPRAQAILLTIDEEESNE